MATVVFLKLPLFDDRLCANRPRHLQSRRSPFAIIVRKLGLPVFLLYHEASWNGASHNYYATLTIHMCTISSQIPWIHFLQPQK